MIVERVDSYKPMFKLGQRVKHKKTGDSYIITDLPITTARLEYCNESFYAYARNGVTWIRKQSAMEDGRFEIVE